MSVANVEGPMKAIADIRLRIEHGASVNEVISAYPSLADLLFVKVNCEVFD